jgi:hypothetical protein
MHRPPRERVVFVALAIGTIALGLLLHSSAWELPRVVRDKLGDGLWASMVVWCVGVLAPRAPVWSRASRRWRSAGRWREPALSRARRPGRCGTTLGRLVLGSGFDAGDLVAYSLASSLRRSAKRPSDAGARGATAPARRPLASAGHVPCPAAPRDARDSMHWPTGTRKSSNGFQSMGRECRSPCRRCSSGPRDAWSGMEPRRECSRSRTHLSAQDGAARWSSWHEAENRGARRSVGRKLRGSRVRHRSRCPCCDRAASSASTRLSLTPATHVRPSPSGT